MLLDFTDDKSTLIQVMSQCCLTVSDLWCHMASLGHDELIIVFYVSLFFIVTLLIPLFMMQVTHFLVYTSVCPSVCLTGTWHHIYWKSSQPSDMYQTICKLGHHQWTLMSYEQIPVKIIEFEYDDFQTKWIWIYCLQNGGPFVLASVY